MKKCNFMSYYDDITNGGGRRIKSIVLAIIIWRLSDSVRRIYVNRICEYYCCCCLLWMSLDVIVPSIFSCSGEHKRNDVLFVLLNWARNTRITHHLSHSGGFAWPLHWNDWVLHALPSIQPVDIYCVIWDGEHAHNSCAYKLFAIECCLCFWLRWRIALRMLRIIWWCDA